MQVEEESGCVLDLLLWWDFEYEHISLVFFSSKHTADSFHYSFHFSLVKPPYYCDYDILFHKCLGCNYVMQNFSPISEYHMLVHFLFSLYIR